MTAFIARFAGDPPPFHVILETELAGDNIGSARLEGVARGDDYSARLAVSLAGQPLRGSQIIVVGGTGYLADAGSDEWRMVPDYETVPPLNPLVDPARLGWTPLGADPGWDGAYRLHATDWSMPVRFLRDARLGQVAFDVWLAPDGQPLAAELAFRLGGVGADGLRVAHEYRARYQFSQFGEPVEIAVPGSSP